jgi:dihydroxyacid dehydratase/phosphogluconate dehydratase
MIRGKTEARGFSRRLTQYGDPAFAGFLRTAFLKASGYTEDAVDKPIIGIASTESDFNPCHASAPALIAAIQRGVTMAGGLPFRFPTISLHESFAYPSSMLLRNLMAMDTEEMLRALPLDAVVLIGGCDKTIPAQLMAAVSADVPALVAPVGPMSSCPPTAPAWSWARQARWPAWPKCWALCCRVAARSQRCTLSGCASANRLGGAPLSSPARAKLRRVRSLHAAHSKTP